MAGIYIHIPFCKSRCYYCDFYSSTNLSITGNFIHALQMELNLRSNFFDPSDSVSTIYFGGGTPSLIRADEIKNILKLIFSKYPTKRDIEITLEANPDDLNSTVIQQLRDSGINRLSVGIQSFFDDHLELMNRRHTASEAIDCVKNAQLHGFNNISVDLIYGIPGMTMQRWIENIKMASEIKIQHISAYHLTIERNTRFFDLIEQRKMKEIDEESSYEQYANLVKLLNNQGYVQYEISNFCLEGYRSRHNSSYWNNSTYLGLGPSAHSYDGNKRYWNIADVGKYCKHIENRDTWYDQELLTEKDKINEYLLTSLRTSDGLSIEKLESEFNIDDRHQIIKKIERLSENSEIMVRSGNRYALTSKGLFLSDHIISDLFIE